MNLAVGLFATVAFGLWLLGMVSLVASHALWHEFLEAKFRHLGDYERASKANQFLFAPETLRFAASDDYSAKFERLLVWRRRMLFGLCGFIAWIASGMLTVVMSFAVRKLWLSL